MVDAVRPFHSSGIPFPNAVNVIRSSAVQSIPFPNEIIAPLEHGISKVKLMCILPRSISKHNHPFVDVDAHLPILPIGMLVLPILPIGTPVDNQCGTSGIPHPMLWMQHQNTPVSMQQKNAPMSQNKGGKLSSMSLCDLSKKDP